MTSATMKEVPDKQAADLSRLTLYRGLVARLPVTMRPSVNQQLDQWEMLFPFEQKRLAEFPRGLESLPPASLDALTRPLRTLEANMGVEHWNFVQDSDTMGNASLLARSEYYAEWRREVQRVFEAVNAAGHEKVPSQPRFNRILLMILPESLPVDPTTVWKQWDQAGEEFKIAAESRRLIELLLNGQLGIGTRSANLADAESSDLWLIDAEAKLCSFASALPAACSLSYAILKPFRDKFLAEANTVSKSIQGADQILTAMRHQDWTRWWPADLAGQARLRNFVIDLFLSGNGALIFSNAFVEWAASEALRRARPRVMIARFGMRSRPKPFTSIAIFENQQQVSTLPDVDDPENSAIDAAILARYVWLAATRYPEYEQTYTLCISENANSGYVIAPAGGRPLWSRESSVTVEEVHKWIVERLSA